MTPTLVPPSPADASTLYPPEPEAPGWQSWHPADPWAHGMATLLLPPAMQSRSLPPIPYGTLGPPTELLPPPMLGPVRVEEPWIAPPAPVNLFAPASTPASATAPAPAAVSTPVPAPLPIDLYPLERCAAIDASIARRPDRAPEILAEHGLEAPAWEALHRHWSSAIQAELGRGRSSLLRAHDAAFVTQLEQERGPLTPEELALLVVAAERGRRDEALAGLDLPLKAAFPIERVCLARAAQDAKLRARLRAAREAARAA